MSKKVKILISVMVAVLLVVAGATVIMADEEDEPATEIGRKGLLARVADILDVPQDELIDAFNQARLEMRQEAFTGAIDRVRERGCITQEDADQVEEWGQQRLELMNRARLHRFCAPSASGQCYLWREHHGEYGPGPHRSLCD